MRRVAGMVAILSCVGMLGAVGALAAAPVGAVVVPGTWSVVPSADPGPTPGGNAYNGISCVGPNFCIAVGNVNNNNSSFETNGLASLWNGTSWSAISGANPGPGTQDQVALESASCTSATFCMAAGFFRNTNHVFTEIWNGSTWTAETAPAVDPHDRANYLYGVSCTSPTSCTAVGWAYSAGPSIPLIESWDGKSWTLDTTPSYTDAVQLDGVSCAGTSCQAVGQLGTAPLAIALNGTTATTEPTPPGSGSAFLNGVSCYTANFCMAVGGQNQQRANYQFNNLAEEWNGTAWTLQTTPDTNATFGNTLDGVDCFGPTSCVAGGWVNLDNTGAPYTNAAIDWNGTTWTVESVPTPSGTNANEINAIDCVPNNLCLAVGNQGIVISPLHRSPHHPRLPPRLCGSGLRWRTLQLRRPLLRFDGRQAPQ